VVLDQDGRILKVPNLGYTVGQSLKDVVLLPERLAKPALHKRIARWSALAACLCLLLLGSWVWQSPIGTVRMHINPDVLLSVNRFDRVVALEGLNEDGTALIDGYRAYGQEMKTVSDELADRAMELGYLSAGGQITLTVDSEKGDWKTAAEELLLLELEVHFEQRVTVTVDGRQPPAGQEPTEEIIIPSQPEEDPDKDDTDDDFDDDTQVNGAHDDNEDDGIGDDDDDDLDAAVSTSGDSEDEDEQDDTPPGFVSGDDDDDDTQDSDDDDLEAPDDADDSDPDDENGDD
jgi:hypothetical protein